MYPELFNEYEHDWMLLYEFQICNTSSTSDSKLHLKPTKKQQYIACLWDKSFHWRQGNGLRVQQGRQIGQQVQTSIHKHYKITKYTSNLPGSGTTHPHPCSQGR